VEKLALIQAGFKGYSKRVKGVEGGGWGWECGGGGVGGWGGYFFFFLFFVLSFGLVGGHTGHQTTKVGQCLDEDARKRKIRGREKRENKRKKKKKKKKEQAPHLRNGIQT